MWTIDDVELHQRLREPLVLRSPTIAEQAPQDKCPSKRSRAPERGPNGEYFPWQVPFPNEKEWQEFLAAFFHELRDKPEAKRVIFAAIDRLSGNAPKGSPQ